MSFKWIWGIVIAIVVLAVIHWYLVSRPSSVFNAYAPDLNPVESSTPDQAAAATSTTDSGSNANTTITTNKNFMHTITIETTKGKIVFETYDADAPKTVDNFIKLAEKGFYSGLIFHRVIPGFMIQGGDPTGTGTGGPGYQFADELDPSTDSYKGGYVKGTVAMANSGPNTNGSQFFIMQKDTSLPHSYSIFGKVISGLEVVDAIANAPRSSSDKPLSDIKMTKVTVTTKTK
jgi:cyclophilin family peptidyl-prolyl cis-trans isomerase